MKRIVLTILLVFCFSISFAQDKEFEVKKILSPQFGKIPSGKTKVLISDNSIVITTGQKKVEYKIDTQEASDLIVTYFSKKGSQNDIRFTYYKDQNYLKFENKDNFTGKVGELNYYF